MSARLLERKRITQERLYRAAKPVIQRVAASHACPGLALLRVGVAAAAPVYLCSKRKMRHAVGFRSLDDGPPAAIAQAQLIALITRWNADSAGHGILRQSLLPAHLDEEALIDSLDSNTVRDRFQAITTLHLAQRRDGLRRCTLDGVMTLLGHTERPVRGERAVRLGVSDHVGRPLARAR